MQEHLGRELDLLEYVERKNWDRSDNNIGNLILRVKKSKIPPKHFSPKEEEIPPGCIPWNGPKELFQREARRFNNVVQNGIHLWYMSTCKTKMCLAHTKALRPRTLDYQEGICVYCGLDADTKDHLLPKGWAGDERSWVLTVPSCRECNSAINDHWAPTINRRRDIAHQFIKRKYSKYIKAYRHNLDEYGPNLRSYINSFVDVGRISKDRMSWPPYDSYDLEACLRSGIEDPYEIGLLDETPQE